MRKISKENDYNGLVKYNLKNVIGGGEDEDEVYLSFNAVISNEFCGTNINLEETELLSKVVVLAFDNKCQIDNTIAVLEKLKDVLDSKEDTQ